MAIQLQLRKGTKVQNDAFTGAEGELTYDTDSKGLRVHDGQTSGGHMIDTVVAWQAPTAENNYTWYRKYSSGWVEQGGYTSMTDTVMTIDLPVTMSNTSYTLLIFQEKTGDGQNVPGITNKTASSFSINASGTANGGWQVSGMTA